jgi:hypothetical protein
MSLTERFQVIHTGYLPRVTKETAGGLMVFTSLITPLSHFLKICTGIVATTKEAAAAALKAGLDIELPNPTMYPQGLKDALSDGLVTIVISNVLFQGY